MALSRLRSLKALLAILLPFLMFGAGSEFMHNHVARCACVPTSAALSAWTTSSAPNRAGGDCPACSWDRSGQSNVDYETTLVQTTATSDPIPVDSLPVPTRHTRLCASRAPPAC